MILASVPNFGSWVAIILVLFGVLSMGIITKPGRGHNYSMFDKICESDIRREQIDKRANAERTMSILYFGLGCIFVGILLFIISN